MLDKSLSDVTQTHNVQGWERAASLAGGTLMIGRGVRQGGMLGLLQVAIGGLALARGVKGHCQAKSWWQKQRGEYNSLKADIDEGAEKLKALKDIAVAATREATVTGKDPLVG